MHISYIIILVTVIISYLAWNNEEIMTKSLFYPVAIKNKKDWYRFISYGFVHANMQHLIFNMLSFYFFAISVERYFSQLFDFPYVFILFYFSALIVSSIPDYFRHQNDPSYRAVGASGAVSAVLFASVVFDPWQSIYFFFIPIPIPGIVFAIAYIAYSRYMDKRGMDNIGHNAHLWGAIFGLVFPFLLKPGLIKYFIETISHPPFLN